MRQEEEKEEEEEMEGVLPVLSRKPLGIQSPILTQGQF